MHLIPVSCDYTLQMCFANGWCPCTYSLWHDLSLQMCFVNCWDSCIFPWHGLRLLVANTLDLDYGSGSLELCFLIWSNVFEINQIGGLCSPLNKLSIESKITQFRHRSQKLWPFYRVSSVLIFGLRYDRSVKSGTTVQNGCTAPCECGSTAPRL